MRQGRSGCRRWFMRASAAGALGFAGCAGSRRDATTPPGTTRSPASSSTAAAASSPAGTVETTAEAADRYVDAAAGDDGAAGTRDAPVATIQAALERVRPGETVYVLPGEYRAPPGREKPFVHTVRGGEPGKPITVTGPPGARFAGGTPGGFLIRHSHVHVRGLTFDGLLDPEHPEDPASYAPDLVSAIPREGDGYLSDVVVKPHAVGNCAGSAVQFAYANHVEVGEFRVVGPCGTRYLYSDEPGHEGEVVYVGTPWDSPEVEDFGEYDRSRDYHVHHVDNSAGHPHAELVDVKAGVRDVTVEYCTDADGSGSYVLARHAPTSEQAVALRGRNCTLRWCVLADGHGAGVEIASEGLAEGDAPEELADAGTDNAVYGNRIVGNAARAVRFGRNNEDGEPYVPERYGPSAQRVICENEYDGETDADPDSPCPDWVPAGDGIGHTGGDSPWASGE